MVSLMNKYQLLEYYQDLTKIRKPFYVFEELLKRFLPKTAEHLVIKHPNKAFRVKVIRARPR